MKKRIFALLLALCMVFGMTTVALGAEGTGTAEDPMVITTLGGTATQAAGQDGVWYAYTAPVAGFVVVSDVEASVKDAYTAVNVYNNTLGIEKGVEGILYANAGETVLIHVKAFTFDEEFNPVYVASNITWSATFTACEEITILGGTAVQQTGENGYWYKHVATATGVMTFNSITSDVEGAKTAHKVINVSEDMEYTGDDVIRVKEGDILLIQVRSYEFDENYNLIYNEAVINWNASIKVIGTSDTPEEIELMNMGSYQLSNGTTVKQGTDGYYYVIPQAPATGKFYMYISSFGTTATTPEIIITSGGRTVKYSESEETKMVTGGGMRPEQVKIVSLDVTMGAPINIQIKDNGEGTNETLVLWNAALEEPLGSAGNPYSIEDYETTITVPAYSQVYYRVPYEFMSADKVYFESTNANVFIGNPMGGIISVDEDKVLQGFIETLTMQYTDVFGVANFSPAAEECTIKFTFPLGSSINPEVLNGTDKQEMPEYSDFTGYNYTWTATEDGIATFKFEGLDNVGFRASVNSEDYSVYGAIYSIEGDSIVVQVKKDDVLTINVIPAEVELVVVEAEEEDSEPYEYIDAVPVAGTITTTVSFAEPSGALMDSETIVEIEDDLWTGKYEGEDYITINKDEDGEVVEEPVTVIPVDLLLVVKSYNETTTSTLGIQLVLDGYTWDIDTTTVGENPIPVDLGIAFETENTDEEVIAETAEGNEYTTFSIAHNGEFGFKAKLTFAVDEKYAGKNAVLYWDKDGVLTKAGECEVYEDGTVAYDFEHASDYVIVFEGTAPVVNPQPTPTPTPDPEPTPEVPETGDSTNVVLWFAVLALGLAAIAGSVVMKKREF